MKGKSEGFKSITAFVVGDPLIRTERIATMFIRCITLNGPILFYHSLIGLVLPDIKPVPIFQYGTKWVLKVVYIKHLLMVISFHLSSKVWPASPASCQGRWSYFMTI